MRDPTFLVAFAPISHRVAGLATILSMLAATLGCGDSPSGPSPAFQVKSVIPITGPSGSAVDVTITGTGFRPGATVTFDAAATNVVVVSDTTITATALPHPEGPVDVVVTNPGGNSARLAGGYRYVPVEILSVTPKFGVAGSTVLISGTGFLAGSVVMFDGIPATISAVTSTSITATVPDHANGPVTVVVTNPGGQRDTRGGAFVYDVQTTVTVTPTTIAPGGQLRVTWTAPGSRVALDWIGLFRLGDVNTAYLWYEYTGGAESGTLTVTAPMQPGQYQFRYLLDDGYVDTARSEAFTVAGSSPPAR